MGCGSSKSRIEVDKQLKKKDFPIDGEIAIVGIGAGGIHMAYELSQRGCKNITIFEKEDQIGGKAKKFTAEGKDYDMQTIFMYTNKNINDLLTASGANFVKYDPMESSIYTDKEYQNKFDYFKKLTGKSTISLGVALRKCISKYKDLYNDITDKFGFPKVEYSEYLSKTTADFLDHNDLGLLKHVFKARLDVTGYGSIENIPAFYGIMGVTPESILNEIKVTYSSSWNEMWDVLLKKSGAKVILNSNVSSVEYKDGKVFISLDDNPICFDFVVLATPKIHNLIKNKTYLQDDILSKVDQMCYSITSLYKYTQINYDIPMYNGEMQYIPERNDETSLTVTYKKFKDINQETGGQYLNSITSEKLEKAKKTLKEDLKSHNKDIEVINTEVTSTYFPHFNNKAIEKGYPWKLFKLQGENKMWFVGASSTFDLTFSIVNYNHKLLDQYDFGNMQSN